MLTRYLVNKYVKISRNPNSIRNLSVNCSINYAISESHKEPERTALYPLHVRKQGKLVNFADYLLPVQYANESITSSHLHTRSSASIFDVSHMLQTYVHGKHAIECIEKICTADLHNLPDNSGTLTVFPNDNGGILDDLIVSRIDSNNLYVVSNAARKEHDQNLMLETVERFRTIGKQVNIEFLTPMQQSLIAVQGPESVKAVQSVTNVDLNKLYFMQTTLAQIGNVKNCRITRCGYTGEDGVEISIPADQSEHIVEMLLASENVSVKLAGLGARDSLRLEAGLCLYGNDIDENTTPIEAGLAWLIAKRRRNDKDFRGYQKILEQLANGCEQRRVGIRMLNGPPARHDIEIFNDDQMKIGHITSGCPSPSLGGNIAMGYVQDFYKKISTKIHLKIRDKFYTGEITRMPFVPAKYYNLPKK